MKKLFLLISLACPSLIFAQSFGSLSIFSENGDRFFLFLDGVRQNVVACANIRVQDLPDLYYSAKISFEDSSIASISKNNLYVSDGDDIMRDASYRIRREKNGKPKLSFYSIVPVRQNFVPETGMYVFHFGQPSVSETAPVPEKKAVSPVSASMILGSLTVFSQNGDKFFLFLNGMKQNDVAQSNIHIRDIPGPYYNARIVFKDSRIAPIIKNNLFISDGDDNLMDAAYRIRRDKAGKPKLNFYSMKTIQADFIPPAGMYVYNFGNPASGIASSLAHAAATAQKAGTASNLITDIKITDPASSKIASGKAVVSGNKNDKLTGKPTSTSPATVKTKPAEPTVSKPSGSDKLFPENKKCNGWPMGKGDLAAAKKIIEEAGKEEAKLQAAQEVIASNCLLTSQVTEFCNMFKSERSKLAFAKYAYKFTIDRKNYSEVNKALSLETSKKELNRFINGG